MGLGDPLQRLVIDRLSGSEVVRSEPLPEREAQPPTERGEQEAL